MAAKEEKKTKDEVITAVYKVNLHCQQCARDIKKPLLKTQGVHRVDVDTEKCEIKVKGVIEVIKIHKLIERLSKKKVELVSPQVKVKESSTTEKKIVKEIKEETLRTTTIKVRLHCDKCENDLRKKLLKHQGIYSVKTDVKAQTITIQGIIESDKLLAYMRKKVHKNAEIIISKIEKKEEKKSEKSKIGEENKGNVKLVESAELMEFKAEKIVEVKTKEQTAPYFIHYVYAPQMFSDENPNACSIL